jgi:antitoxin (DNA-binding transcriptional repressor) of toxin-antitoxin stability system
MALSRRPETTGEQFLEYIRKGKGLQIERRNVPIAKIVPLETPAENRTKLSLARGSGEFLGDVTKSVMREDWELDRS